MKGSRVCPAICNGCHSDRCSRSHVPDVQEPKVEHDVGRILPRVLSLFEGSLEILKHSEERARRNGVSQVRTYSSLGDAVGFILEVAEREKADTIVLGKRGKGRLPGLLIGSASQKLVSLARCNVLVVP